MRDAHDVFHGMNVCLGTSASSAATRKEQMERSRQLAWDRGMQDPKRERRRWMADTFGQIRRGISIGARDRRQVCADRRVSIISRHRSPSPTTRAPLAEPRSAIN